MKKILVILIVILSLIGFTSIMANAGTSNCKPAWKCVPTTTIAPTTTTSSTTTTVPPTTTSTSTTSTSTSSTSTTTTTVPTKQVISACGFIPTGDYIVTADIIQTIGGQCLGTFGNGTTVDCQGHQVHSAYLNTNSFVTLKNCAFDGFVYADASDHFTLLNSAFTNNAELQLRTTTDSEIAFNSFRTSSPPKLGAATISDDNGARNYIHDNNLDGGATGYQVGYDDGIILYAYNAITIDSDRVENNIIANYWDAAIETVGQIRNTVFSNNTFINIYLTGIGAWYYNSWIGNTVSNNTMYNVKFAFYFYNHYGAAVGDTAYFINNQFIGNQVISYMQVFTTPQPAGFFNEDVVNDPRDPFTSQPVTYPEYQVTYNNLFANNDLRHDRLAPKMFPTTGFIDGGGNICGGASQQYGPLTCL